MKPNLKVLGKRCGPKLKEVTATLTAWGHAEVVSLEAGETITVAGESITVADVLLQRTPVAGAVVASAGWSNGAGTKLGAIASITEGSSYTPQPMQGRMMQADMAMKSSAPVPVAQGELVISADVNMVWELE